MHVKIAEALIGRIPDFTIGVINYHDITVSEMPQMIRGRYHYFQDEKILDLKDKALADLNGIKKWREAFKLAGTDPSRYRPSHEALFRRLKKGERLPDIHSAVDLNNYFSVKYCMPIGIYDTEKISGPVIVKIGAPEDGYEGINGREVNMENKLLTADGEGAFGSPIVDSKRTMVTPDTRHALHILYFPPGIPEEKALTQLNTITEAMTHVHGGQALCHILDRDQIELKENE